MTTPFKEVAGSPVLAVGPGELMATRVLLVAWEQRLDLLGELLGSGWQWGFVYGKQFPGLWWLVADNALVEPFESRPDHQGDFTEVATQLNAYTGQLAKITVHYRLLS